MRSCQKIGVVMGEIAIVSTSAVAAEMKGEFLELLGLIWGSMAEKHFFLLLIASLNQNLVKNIRTKLSN